jgi:hypothetical protein
MIPARVAWIISLGSTRRAIPVLLWTVDTPTSPHATPSRTTQIGRIDRRQFHRGDCKGLLADVPVERSGSSNAVSGETIVRPQCPRRGTYMVAQPPGTGSVAEAPHWGDTFVAVT